MYQVLYRKYRPKIFADVYGQDHVTSTLKNEIVENRISHAYLFTGSRGTGKTTCAKILAKAVNCENSRNGEPCNECEICQGLDAGTIYDVVEIDAASNNGVDNIRELREEVNYAPSRGRYRVYIIDEVHMLSTGAFNALLKTLEEPPAHVIFILATTEVHKLPATILSRCQRFDFKRIQPETMAVRLKQVAEAEGMTLTDSAATLIARIADGALRDGLSVLDQCAGRASSIDESLVSEVAGIANREILYKLSDCISNKDSSECMSLISNLYQNSYDMERLCVEMINHFRNFLITKTVKKSRELIICTDDEYNMILNGARSFTMETVIYALDLFQDALTKIKGGASARIEVELSFVKLCEPNLEVSNDSMLDRLSRLEIAVKNGAKTISDAKPQATESQPIKEEAKSVAPEKQADVIEEQSALVAEEELEKKEEVEPPVPTDETDEQIAPTEQELPPIQPQATEQAESTEALNTDASAQQPFEYWDSFLSEIYKLDIATYSVIANASAYTRGEFFLIDSSNPTIKEFLKISTRSRAIKQALYNVTGKKYKLGLFKRSADEVQKQDLLEALINSAENNVKINFE